jgi:hypothetical protein
MSGIQAMLTTTMTTIKNLLAIRSSVSYGLGLRKGKIKSLS